jgi:hypothetical protein
MALQPVTLQLPDDLVKRAQAAGLFAPERAEDLFRRELERQGKIANFFELADRLTQLNQTDPITPEEIEAEIQAARAERRQRRESAAGH